MKVEIKYGTGFNIIKIIGNIKYYDIDDFTDVINTEIQKGNIRFIFDMKEFPYINSAVIGEFVKIIKQISEKNGKVCFCNVRPYLLNILEITGLTKLFNIYPDVLSARNNILD